MNIDIILNNYKKFLNTDEEIKNNICLISHENINDEFNIIKLPCGHTFDYSNLYKEFYNQKNFFYKIENKKNTGIKCPYCRKPFNKILPYYEIENINQVNGINHPNKDILDLYSCEWIYKSGKNKGNKCIKCANKYKIGNYCTTHFNQIKKKENYKTCEQILKSGKNKGKPCGCKIMNSNNKYCKRHLIN